MSKQLKNFTKDVMEKIHNNQIKMKPKIYFTIGAFLTFVGLVFSIIISIFFVSLIRFFLRAHCLMASYRLNQIISNFPWWILAFAIFGLIIGIWLIRRYDFSYKINFKLLIFIFILAIIIAGLIIDAVGLNDILFRQGPGQRIMRKYFQENNVKFQYNLNSPKIW